MQVSEPGRTTHQCPRLSRDSHGLGVLTPRNLPRFFIIDKSEMKDYLSPVPTSAIQKVEREAALEKKFSRPYEEVRKGDWGYRKAHKAQKKNLEQLYCRKTDRHRVRFGSLPEWMRPIAEQELQRLIAQTKARGREITRHKLASLIGNATLIARDVRCSNAWALRCFKYLLDGARHRKLQDKRVNVLAERLSAIQDAGMERGE